MKVKIIGAGIGGLTTAIALQNEGIDFEIYESFKGFKDLGAGISLANNAMQVYNALGLKDKIVEAGHSIDFLKLRADDLSTLTAIPTHNDNGLPTVAIHRSALQKVLLAQISQDKIHLGKKLLKVDNQDDEINLTFEDGHQISTDILLGADGIHSVVRQQVFNQNTLRDSGQICWRGIVDYTLPTDYQSEMNEVWGQGIRMGFVQIDPRRVYWFALQKDKGDKKYTKQDILDIFSGFDPLLKNILKATPEASILTNRLIDLKPIKQYYKGNICLIGDAAHATTPNMGQGACQSIEDAYVIAKCLANCPTPQDAFAQYQSLRIKKATKIVTNSWHVGKMAHWDNKLVITIRNRLMQWTPSSIMKKQNQFLNDVALL